MKQDTLEKLYIEELRDIYSAETSGRAGLRSSRERNHIESGEGSCEPMEHQNFLFVERSSSFCIAIGFSSFSRARNDLLRTQYNIGECNCSPMMST